MNLPDLRKLQVENKKVIVRSDLDGPDNDNLGLSNLSETLNYLVEKKSRIILIGHKGRPEGQVNGELSLAPVAKRLAKLLGREIKFVYDVTGAEAEKETSEVGPGSLLMLENLRFDAREEKNDEEFAKRLAGFGEVYINECFADSHRRHGSIVGIPKFLPHAPGFRFIAEIENLGRVLEKPQSPVVFIIGGAKVDKAKYVDRLLDRADWVLVGGLLPKFVESYCRSDDKICVVSANLLPSGKDIDEASITNFSAIISQAGTIVWNGPMGEYENPEFVLGTQKVGQAIVENGKSFKVVGGGDTALALQSLGILERINWVSSGGGAMLEFLSGGTVPGIEALRI